MKGESSGNKLKVVDIFHDCDKDTILIKAIPFGPTCHTGSQSCFQTEPPEKSFFHKLDQIIQLRKSEMEEGSYTAHLFQSGINQIAQKVGEEATESIIAAINQSDEDFLNEAADLIYHLNVLLVEKGLSIDRVETVLKKRHDKSN